MPLQATSGAASYDAFGGGVPVVPTYIEDVMSTWLYTGNGSTQTITNGIDLSTKGGLVWCKNRTSVQSHELADTARGYDKSLRSNTTDAQFTGDFGGFNSNGFSLIYANSGNTNESGKSYVSWTFRKQPKFFDVVTYTGTGSNTTIPHNLGSAPGCMIVKCTSNAVGWNVYHRSLTSAAYQLELNTTSAEFSDPTIWNSTAPTSTVFSVGTNLGINGSGRTYVAYLFAHDAGGFGLTGTDNVISCGSFTADGSGYATVNLGYEPQFLITKVVSAEGYSWRLLDTMRGWSQSGNDRFLTPNSSSAEGGDGFGTPTATGFEYGQTGANTQHIYIAIRRGPMKVPTSGTSVYNAIARTGTGATATITGVGFAPDAVWGRRKDANYGRNFDRLRGVNTSLAFAVTANESSPSDSLTSYNMDGFSVGADPSEHINASSIPYIYWNFKRAPSVCDVVCYTGTGSATTVAHNLAAVPELMIVKRRSYVSPAVGWNVYSSSLANSEYLVLNSTAAKDTGTDRWNSTTPTSSVFSVGTSTTTNASAGTYIAYLFATCAGVSKVGSYTGTATTKQIDCGFTGGARFVLIKRTDSTGDWYVWDSVRGIVSGNDPYLLLNNTDAEVTNTDYIDTYSAGFEISSTAPAAINASGGSFIFLAIA